jgi:hypothetical protein
LSVSTSGGPKVSNTTAFITSAIGDLRAYGDCGT